MSTTPDPPDSYGTPGSDTRARDAAAGELIPDAYDRAQADRGGMPDRDDAVIVYNPADEATREHMRRWAAGQDTHPGEDDEPAWDAGDGAGGFAYVVHASPDGTTWPYDDEGNPRVGTRAWDGPAAQLAQVLLDEYQADMTAGQITLPGPVTALRVMIWPGDSPGPVSQAAAWVRRLPPSEEEADELAVLDATRGLAQLAARHLGEAYDPVMIGAEGYACAFPLEVEGRFLRVTVQLASEDELAAICGEPEVCPVDGTPIDLESGLCLMNCQPADRERWLAEGNPVYDEHAADQAADEAADERAALAEQDAGHLYTYRTESTLTGRWAHAEADRLGTTRYAGTPEEFAAAMLAGYLGDVASDAGLRLGDPGADPAFPVRVIVWTSDQPADLGHAAAVLYHPAGSAPEPEGDDPR